ncbi:hypothetical protein GCM10012275_10940 [Longimycelium tulufanense]|uniref:Uncharacterized protein n=1 Tax=Longimycelium tulufanense TaxID=907463 RepID=A0A8J3FSS2_9PSEU|nr:hypothetical protein GCM10012275_10940 [Longimycelium tulufanense]
MVPPVPAAEPAVRRARSVPAPERVPAPRAVAAGPPARVGGAGQQDTDNGDGNAPQDSQEGR